VNLPLFLFVDSIVSVYMTDFELAAWYTRRAYHNLNQAKRLFHSNNVESIIASFEAIEFSLKALCELLDVTGVDHEHFLKATTISALAKKIEDRAFGKSTTITKMAPILLGYTDDLRIIARYGIQHNQFPKVMPDKIFSKEYSSTVLNDAKTLCSLLGAVEIKNRWLPKVRIGILTGYFSGTDETKCAEHPFANKDLTIWRKKFEELSKASGINLEIEDINSEDISEKYAMIVNPFGEVYPEINVKQNLAFYNIKNYVENGGVYVNTGGFPFFYAWDVTVKENNRIAFSEKRLMVPNEIKFDGVNITVENYKEYLEFTGTLLHKEFNVLPTPVSNDKRPVFQIEEDVNKFGKILPENTQIKEFRALPKNTPDLIPIIRATDQISGEIYPVCVLKRGRGYLLLAGMNTEQELETQIFAQASIGFSAWYQKQLQPAQPTSNHTTV
jgi:HEPN domain-containing protein